MTSEQAAWMRKNPAYRAMGVAGGNSRYVQKGLLHADGIFEAFTGGPYRRLTEGDFEVGILEIMPGPGH